MIRNDRPTTFVRACVLVVASVCASSAAAQDTRADLLAQERAAKAQDAQPAGPGFVERALLRAESLQTAFGSQDGFHPAMGGMIAGSGIAIGPGYGQHLFGRRVIVDVSGTVAWSRSTMMRTRIEWPHFFTNRLSVGGEAKYQDFTQLNYFGIGDSTVNADRTNYRLKDVDVLGFATVRATRWLSVGSRMGVLRGVKIAPGTSSLSPAIGERFDQVTAPGLARQPGYLHGDVSVAVDTQDAPGYATSGGRYRLTVAAFQDQNDGQYSFRRLDADAAQHIPIFHKSWLLTLRGRAVLTQSAPGQEVPFYLLPTLGGSSTLRGFADYRFRDRNLVLVSAEYRWPLMRAMEGALFYDAGKVARSVQALSMRQLHSDYGVGLRLHTDTSTILRVDVARSAEGFRTIVAFTAPLGAPSRSVVPYAP